MTQQEPGELLACPAQAVHRVEPCPYQIAHRLVPRIRNPHRRQLAGPVQLGQTGGIPPIGLDPIARPLRDQRGLRLVSAWNSVACDGDRGKA
jgi:hypothetical protein